MAERAARRTRAVTLHSDVLRAARRALIRAGASGVSFARYFDDPVGFCVDVLGFEPWAGQVRVLEALAKNDAVTVPAGRAVGKSRLDAAAALWFVATRGRGSRVICTAPKFGQIQTIIWEEIRNLFHAAKDLHGECAKTPSTGLRMSDGGQILGLTAEKPEGFQGIRAPQMLVIADEASGIEDPVFTVIDGNCAGGAKLLLTGNPTKARGYFRESLRSPRFECVHVTSLESPNIVEGRVVIPGLATVDWLEERKREWGEDSPLYKIHVLGEVVEVEEGRLFTAEMIAAAEAAWPDTQPSGRLSIGVDPAGPQGDGDESAFAARRGRKVAKLYARRGLTEEAHLVEVLGLIAQYKGDSVDTPLVIIDRDGYIGAKVYAAFGAYLVNHEGAFQLYGVRGGERARRKPLVYDRVRDEVWFSLVDAFRDGLAIPEDVKLARELAAVLAEAHISGRSKVTAKDDLRRELGRSPDRADALALASLDVTEWKPRQPYTDGAPIQHDPYRDPRARGIDPYAAMDVWSAR